MSSRDSHTIQQARKYVDQLRREKNVNRFLVSQCVVDLIKFVQENQRDDYLINGFASDKMNPYRPKNNFQCLLL